MTDFFHTHSSSKRRAAGCRAAGCRAASRRATLRRATLRRAGLLASFFLGASLLVAACAPGTDHDGHSTEPDPHSGMDRPNQQTADSMDMPEQQAADGMDMSDQLAAGGSTVLIDPVTIQNIGVRTTLVDVRPLPRTVRATGHFVMDEQAERTISPKVSGWVEYLEADFDGKRVQAGDHLFDLYSPEVLSTQEELLAARTFDEGLAESARRRLRLWDIPEHIIEQVERTGIPLRTIPFHAPVSGEIMRKKVTEGAHISAGDRLMDIVDISRTWLIVDVHEQDLAWVGVGTHAKVELPWNPGNSFDGEIDYIYHMLNEPLRAARARIVLSASNAGGHAGGHSSPFKPGMFATVWLEGTPAPAAPVVPTSAIVRDGRHEVVIQDLGGGRFQPVSVTSGLTSDGYSVILEGLSGGERIVTSAQFLIDSESRLGAAMAGMAGMDMDM